MHLGLIDIKPGPRLVNVFRLSNRWRTIDTVEAERLAELAREVQPHRRFERRRAERTFAPTERRVAPAPKPEPKPVKPPKPMTIERPRSMQRRVPSLPQMPWHDDGR